MEEKSKDYASSTWNFIAYICSFKIIFFFFLLRPLWIIVQVKSFFFYFVYFFFYSPLLHYILTAIFHSSSPLSLYPYLPFPLDQLLLRSFLKEKNQVSMLHVWDIHWTWSHHITRQHNVRKRPKHTQKCKRHHLKFHFSESHKNTKLQNQNIYAKDLAQTHSGSIQT